VLVPNWLVSNRLYVVKFSRRLENVENLFSKVCLIFTKFGTVIGRLFIRSMAQFPLKLVHKWGSYGRLKIWKNKLLGFRAYNFLIWPVIDVISLGKCSPERAVSRSILGVTVYIHLAELLRFKCWSCSLLLLGGFYVCWPEHVWSVFGPQLFYLAPHRNSFICKSVAPEEAVQVIYRGSQYTLIWLSYSIFKVQTQFLYFTF
jgi:hypothetical protein